MKNKFSAILIGSSVILGGFGLAMTATSAQAVTLTTSSLQTNTQYDSPASWYGAGFTVNGNGTVTFSLTNNTNTNPTNSTIISNVYFGTDGDTAVENDGFFKYFVKNAISFAGSSSGTSYQANWNVNPNSGPATWGVEILADPLTGNNNSVVNAGETLKVTFNLNSTYASYTAAQLDPILTQAFFKQPGATVQDLGMVFHVQRIDNPNTTGNDGYSEWYQALPGQTPPPPPVSKVPEPASLFGLGLVATGMVMARRRRSFAN